MDGDIESGEGAPSGEPPHGYLSEDAKKRFTLTVGILGALALFLQLALPFVGMGIVMPLAMFSGRGPFGMFVVKEATFWRGQIYLIETPMPNPGAHKSTSRLMRVSIGAKTEPEVLATLERSDVRLLAADDALWLISSDSVSQLQDGKVVALPHQERLGDICRPFLYQGRPAVVEESPGKRRILIYDGGAWKEASTFVIEMPRGQDSFVKDLQVVPLPDGLHLFLKHGETVFYRWEAPGAEFAKEKRWTPVAKARLLWSATHKGNEPVLFVVGGPGKEPGEFGQEIVGLKRDGESWQPFVTVPGAMDFGALMVEPADEKGSFVLITQSFPGRVRTLLLEDGRVARDAGYGSAFPFAILMPMMGLIFAAMLVVPLVLSFVLSPLMRWYRVDHVTAGTRSAFQAPIWRRAFAELTDGLLLFGPAATGYVLMMSSFTDPDRLLRPIVILPAMGFVMGGLLWLPVCFVLFCFTEGKWGRTPGKWLTGIQVLGTDLRPCGFGRALVRNLLKVVDGFFNFMVGILVAALSENWQRLGDMAARTVVIRVDGGSGASGSTIQ